MTELDGAVPQIAEDALYFVPLGGSDEIGMNLYLYWNSGPGKPARIQRDHPP